MMIKQVIISFYRKVVPLRIKKLLCLGNRFNQIWEWYLIKRVPSRQRKALQELQGKEKIRCVFFALFDSVWKYDVIYRIMEKHPRFEPVILVCPIVNYGRVNMLKNMEESLLYYKKKGFRVLKSYDEKTDSYLDVRKTLNPDIIFFTNPYKGLIDDQYFITEFQDKLTIYVPYSMNNSKAHEANYGLILYNLLWRHYLPTTKHLDYSIAYSRNKGRNSVVSGYPAIEELVDGHETTGADWKLPNKELKKIIWAPHHTIEPVGVVYFSCFLRYCDFMIKMACKYSDKIQMVFKPHPLLKNKLDLLWGKEKADAYYAKWKKMPNTNVNEGDYIDLFLTSDAMIHDSGSFISEYLYVNKPVMRTLNDVDESEKMNDFAMECISNHYLAKKESDIEQFIQNVIHDVDPLKDKRTKFVEQVLMPKGSPSENIVNDILDSIDHQVLYRN